MTRLRRGIVWIVLALAVSSLAACSSRMVGDAYFPTAPVALEGQITRDDAQLARSALLTALNTDSMATRTWSNRRTGHAGAITPNRGFTSDAGLKCVEYRDEFTVGGKSGTAVNTACRGPDGIWQNMDGQGRWQAIG